MLGSNPTVALQFIFPFLLLCAPTPRARSRRGGAGRFSLPSSPVRSRTRALGGSAVPGSGRRLAPLSLPVSPPLARRPSNVRPDWERLSGRSPFPPPLHLPSSSSSLLSSAGPSGFCHAKERPRGRSFLDAKPLTLEEGEQLFQFLKWCT